MEAYRKQLKNMPPGLVLLAWRDQSGMDADEMLDEFKKAEEA
jgi:hypothetical protein